MGTLEDQLKQWKKQTGATTAPAAPPTTPSSRRAQKKKPLLQTIRRDEPPAPPPPKAPPPLNDAELFAAAIEGVSQDAVLDKFSAAPTVKVKGQTLQPSPPKDDGALFAEFIGLRPMDVRNIRTPQGGEFVGTVQPKGAPPKKR